MTNIPRHPRLFFGPGDIAALRRKIEHPALRADWEDLRRKAEQALAGPAVAEGWPADVLSAAARNAARCAFAHVLSEEERFAERALEITAVLLDRAPEWPNRMIPAQQLPFHLQTAAVCAGLARVYDWLAPLMSPEESARFVRAARTHGIDVFIADCRNPRNPNLCQGRTMNWVSVLASGAGLLALALDGEGVDLAKEIEIARAHMLRFIEWYDDAGCATEHGGYWRYGMGHCVEFLAALRRNGWPDIWKQRSGKLERTPYPNLYCGLGGLNAANFGDDNRTPLEARDVVSILAAEYRNPRLQWWADRMPPGGDLTLIYYDPSLRPSPPDDWPTCMAFPGCGIGVLRDSLSDPRARFLAIKAGKTRGAAYDDPHCHMDLNSIVVEAFGESLLADPGYGHNWANPTHSPGDPEHPYNGPAAHNSLLVNGRGPVADKSPFAELQVSPAAEVDYLVSRVVRGYPAPLLRFDRHVFMVAQRFWVVADDVELAKPAVLTWSFHAAREAALETGPTSTIRNGCAALAIVPRGTLAASVSEAAAQVLPCLRYTADAPSGDLLAVWLLLPFEGAERPPEIEVRTSGDVLLVREGDREWRLPIVRRRTGSAAPITLEPIRRSS